jgi:hypothetical protein
MSEKLDLDALERVVTASVVGDEYRRQIIEALYRLRELERAGQTGSGEAEDADRYRWLESKCGNKIGIAQVSGPEVRQAWFVTFPVIESGAGMILSDAIDAARASLDGRS